MRLRGRGAGCVLVRHVELMYGSSRHVASRFQNHSLGQRACGCERRGVGWILSRFVQASWVPACQWPVMFTKPPSCRHGGRSTRPWWDRLCQFWAMLASLGHGISVLVAFAQGSAMQAKARQFTETAPVSGTGSDQRGGSGINCGLSCHGAAMSVEAGPDGFGRGTSWKPRSCRHGAGSTPAARDGFWFVGLGLVLLSSVQFRSVWARCVMATNHHAVGAVPVSTPDGGIRLVTASLGKARRVELGHGTVTPPS